MTAIRNKSRRLRVLVFIAGSTVCLFSNGRAQEPGEGRGKGDFLLRPETTFQHYCAPCHGETGRGDGRYFGYGLQPLPRDLTDAEYMGAKTDEELLVSISGGTASIGKSNLCPPWGKTLGRERSEGLVRYLRSLSSTAVIQDTVGTTSPIAAAAPERTGSVLRLAILFAMSLALLGTGWVQWRRLR